jgi:hypothetical protein
MEAPFRDTTPALTRLRISKEETVSCQRETSTGAQIPLYETRIIELAEIYTVATESGKTILEESSPFVHGVELHGPKGETVRLKSVFDDSAGINAINTKVFATVKHRLSNLQSSVH